MTSENQINKEIKTILERLKPTLGKFFEKRIYGEWGLTKNDVRLVDEVGFELTGIPIYSPEIT